MPASFILANSGLVPTFLDYIRGITDIMVGLSLMYKTYLKLVRTPFILCRSALTLFVYGLGRIEGKARKI